MGLALGAYQGLQEGLQDYLGSCILGGLSQFVGVDVQRLGFILGSRGMAKRHLSCSMLLQWPNPCHMLPRMPRNLRFHFFLHIEQKGISELLFSNSNR